MFVGRNILEKRCFSFKYGMLSCFSFIKIADDKDDWGVCRKKSYLNDIIFIYIFQTLKIPLIILVVIALDFHLALSLISCYNYDR